MRIRVLVSLLAVAVVHSVSGLPRGYFYSEESGLILSPRAQKLPSKDSLTLVKADLLIPGDGEPLNDAALVFSSHNGTIVFVGKLDSSDFQDFVSGVDIEETISIPVVMPGMWDVHTHFMGNCLGDGFHDLAAGYAPDKYVYFGCALKMLKESLCAGVTSVRDLGNAYGQSLGMLVRTGLFPGPNFYYASHAIGMTGGHTDQQYLPIQVTRMDYDSSWEGFGAICDGVPECLKKVREQIRTQADVIKIMGSGGVLSAFDQPTDQEFSLEEVRAMVEEADRADRVVAAHIHGDRGIATAIAAGVRTIEHGSYMNETLAVQAKEAGMLYVPTITITQTFNQTVKPASYDDLQWEKGQTVLAHNSAAVRYALKAGLPIATGTDCPGNCAQVGREVNYLHNLFGVSPLDAIKSATANGPLALGKRAPKSGKLDVGYAADIIGMETSPLDSITVLADPDSITFVFKAGQLFKSPTNHFCDNSNTMPKGVTWVPADL
jgi:imidazolonepropionase-like amidohydrolase